MKEKRVALVGMGHGYHLAPKIGNVWTCNNLGIHIYTSMIWDMHNYDWTMEECIANYRHLYKFHDEQEILKMIRSRYDCWSKIENFCNKTGITLMSVKKYDYIPSSRKFPLQQVSRQLNSLFFTSTISYMLAYAICENFTHIDLYGVNVEDETEWAFQRDSVTYWLGYANGKGIKTTVSGSERRPLRIHPILEGNLYSYDIKQPQYGVKRTERVDYLGEMSTITTWDEGPSRRK